MAWSGDTSQFGYFKGTSSCLSALFKAGRHEEIMELLRMRKMVAEESFGERFVRVS